MEANFTYWSELLSHWPADLPRRGILVTAFNEQISFSAFWTSEKFLLLERQTPDSQGARTVMFTYDQILAIKIVDVVKSKQFKMLGFTVPSQL